MDGTLIAEGLVKRFGDFTAVDQISLSVAAGEVVGSWFGAGDSLRRVR